MPATPLNSTTVQVDDTDPALVYSGTWVKFVSTAPICHRELDLFNILEGGVQVSSMSRLMVVHRRVLLYNLFSKVRLQAVSLFLR